MIPDVIEAEAGGDLYKAHVILTDPPMGSSSQATSDDPDLGTPDDAIEPPESLERLALWSSFNGTRRACIDAIARNTVGLGYELVLAPGHERDGGDPRDRILEARERLEALAGRDQRLEKPSFTELLYAVKTDEEEVGWGFLEVSRNRSNGQVDGLFHLPGKRMRRLQSRKGYMLLGPNGAIGDTTYFVPFGSKVEYADQAPTPRLADGHTGGWFRNEVICFRLYTSESRDYGAPRDLALALEYLGDKLANEANAAYFDNGGALPTVLFVQGEEKRDGAGQISVTVPHEVTQRIASVLRSKTGIGPTGTGRVAIIPLPAGVKAQKEVLGQISEKDIGFVGFRDDVRQRTMTAFRMSGVFLALSDDGRTTAEVDRAITKEQVFDPEQERYGRRITNLILRDLGFPELAVDFTDLAVEDDAARRSSAEKGAEVGGITWREYRGAHRWPALTEAARAEADFVWPADGRTYRSAEPEPGQVPYGWNDSLMPAAGRPEGARNRVVEGEGQQGERPGLAGRDSRDRGQAASADRTEGQVRRLSGRAGGGGARRALERARTLPADE